MLTLWLYKKKKKKIIKKKKIEEFVLNYTPGCKHSYRRIVAVDTISMGEGPTLGTKLFGTGATLPVPFIVNHGAEAVFFFFF